jgi:outer membrane lipoprotein-sorting protein
MKKCMLLLSSFAICTALFAQNEVALIKSIKAKLEKVKDYTATGQMKVDVSFINATPSNVVMYYKAQTSSP